MLKCSHCDDVNHWVLTMIRVIIPKGIICYKSLIIPHILFQRHYIWQEY